MTAYTPGPWHCIVHSTPDLYEVFADGRALGIDERAANARLIAQAPAMAEALRLACAYVALYTGNGASIIESEALSHYLRASDNNVDAEAITRHCRAILTTIEGK